MKSHSNIPKNSPESHSNFFSKKVFPMMTAGCITVGSTLHCSAQDTWKFVKWDQKNELVYLKDLNKNIIVVTSIKDIYIPNYSKFRKYNYDSADSTLNAKFKRQEIIENDLGLIKVGSSNHLPTQRLKQITTSRRHVTNIEELKIKPLGLSNTQKSSNDQYKIANVELKLSLDKPAFKKPEILSYRTPVISLLKNENNENLKSKYDHIEIERLLKAQGDKKELGIESKSNQDDILDRINKHIGYIALLFGLLTADYKRPIKLFKYIFGWRIKLQIVRPAF